MKETKYRVQFTNGNYPMEPVEVMAFNERDAIILAKAERIKAGLDCTVYDIFEV